MTGPIRGTPLSAEVKRFIVRAVTDASSAGMPIAKSCTILMIDPRRMRRWIKGRDPQTLSEDDLTDVPPIARVCSHAITADERAEIVAAATDDDSGRGFYRRSGLDPAERPALRLIRIQMTEVEVLILAWGWDDEPLRKFAKYELRFARATPPSATDRVCDRRANVPHGFVA